MALGLASVAAAALCLTLSCRGTHEVEQSRPTAAWPQLDSAAKAQLPPGLGDTLLQPDSIVVYTIEGFDAYSETADSSKLFGRYWARSKRIAKLTEDQQAVLRFLVVTDGGNYPTDGWIASVPSEPAYEFLHYKGDKQRVSMAVSFSDCCWYLFEDREKRLLGTMHDCKAIRRLCEQIAKEEEQGKETK